MCYSDFNLIDKAVAALDADVITIETSRSQMQLLEVFERFNYPNEIGSCVYDIHSPNVPSRPGLRIHHAGRPDRSQPDRLCQPGLQASTRGWEELTAPGNGRSPGHALELA